MSKIINFKIDGQDVKAQKGETILQVARANDIYIPTMCYISKTSPCASCRMCVVEAEGVDGFVLSCNTPPTEGIEITTNNVELEQERVNIMKLYDVNHPLECGVCDKSGECDLQNKTLEFDIGQQNFSAKDQARKIENWGMINYDPALCIMCEKCTHVCNEVIGDDAIDVKFGGYGSTIIPKNAETLDCTFCGECIAVCPVGALISSDFKYSANAWELSRVPSTCAHCSAGCSLEYETRNASIDNAVDSIYRVKNNFEFTSLCGAGRFGFDFANSAKSDAAAFNAGVDALKNAKAIRFSSIITNEEAHILQLLKEKLGVKLFNEDARLYDVFMSAYSSVSGKLHHSGSLDAIKQADAIIILGSRVATDNPGVRYAMTTASRHNGAKIVYAHPIEDALMQNIVTQFMKYEAGAEEGVMALLANTLLVNADLSETEKKYFDDLDLGYLEAESNVGADELETITRTFSRTQKRVLVVGSDVFAHANAANIAKLAAMIEKYTDFSLVVIPENVNTAGVSLVCDLDRDDGSDAVGYNAAGTFVIGSLEGADLAVPALNQQEGTVVSIDNRVLPLNVALSFEGDALNDLANALGVVKENTVDYTQELNTASGFKTVAFDDLENFLDKYGNDVRGYLLDEVTCEANSILDEVSDLPEFNGVVIYHSNPVLQFNNYTNAVEQLEKDTTLRGSAQFSAAARVSDGEELEITFGKQTVKRVFKLDEELKGTVALNPTFDISVDASEYKFLKSKIVRAI